MELLSNRYQVVNKIGEGGMGDVYCVFDRLAGATIALKQVTVTRPDEVLSTDITYAAGTNLYLALAREFQILASLRHPNIVSVLDYGFDAYQQPYYTMEFYENAQTISDFGHGQNFETQVDLIVQLLQALSYLHRRGTLHRDLKPANILVVDGRVKVLDFGLSKPINHLHIALQGTQHYMAPELFDGCPATIATDLYAVGVVAYELITGRLPFQGEDYDSCVHEIRFKQPDLASLGMLGVFIGKLIDKQASQRFSSAGEAIDALKSLLNLDFDRETQSTRESLLQAAQFVGRDAELTQLLAMLTDARKGMGQICLVGGESGVGKSRLVNELRIQGLVQGIQVLRGQTSQEGKTAYQVWRDILRALVVTSELGDLQASVLKPLIPDIETLLSRAVQDAPILEPQASQERMLNTIESLFVGRKEPLMVILEDLHWASNETLEALKRLVDSIKNQSVFIVGTYRDDEYPLYKDLPEIQHIRLRRLAISGIEALSVSMIGAAGRSPKLVNFLLRETEGNVFFLIEVMRALAEEIGELDQVGYADLPESTFTGGVYQIIKRRLDRISDEDRSKLIVAAVAGRYLDLNILKTVFADSDLDQWLDRCVSAATLELHDGHWQFAHDKLRESLLLELKPDARRNLHSQLVMAIEQSDQSNVTSLAYHSTMAGNKLKALHYSNLAGEQALRAGGNQEAISYFKSVLKLNEELYPTILNNTDKRLEQAIWKRKLANAYFALGQFRDGKDYLEQAVTLLDAPIPGTQALLLLGIVGQLFQQMLHRLSPILIRHPRNPNLLREAVQSHIALAEAYYFDRQILQTLYCTLRKINVSEMTNLASELGHSYGSFAIATSLISLRNIAEGYINLAYKNVDSAVDPATLEYTLLMISTYEVGVGRWKKVRQTGEKSIEIGRRIGNQRRMGDAIIVLAYAIYATGKYSEALQLVDSLANMAQQTRNMQHEIWSLALRYRIVLSLGQVGYLEQVTDFATQVLGLSQSIGSPEPGHEIDAHAVLGLMYLRIGNREKAQQEAEIALNLSAKTPSTQSTSIDGHNYLCSTLFDLIRSEKNPDQKSTLSKLAQKATRILSISKKRFGADRSTIYRLQAQYCWLTGKPVKAHRLICVSLVEGEKLGIAYDIAMAHYEIGKHTKDISAKQSHLRQAIEIFAQINANYDMENANVELNSTKESK